MGTIRAVSISVVRGTAKREASSGLLVPGHGLEGDAHAGDWHRQVSLLANESVDKMRTKGLEVGPGAFGENLTTQGLDLVHLPLGTLFVIEPAAGPTRAVETKAGRVPGGAILELTQIGKECHDHCAIFRQVGDCVMPREGVFTRVLRGGPVAAGDRITVLEGVFRVAILTASDKGARGEREDVSGETLRRQIEAEAGWLVVEKVILPDDRQAIASRLAGWADEGRADLILTTGGTGLAPADVTPEATLDVAERAVPGLAEAMRAAGRTKTPRAVLSRAVAVLRRRTLIINLPGSPAGARESLEAILPALGHGLETMTGHAAECGRNPTEPG